MAGILACKRNKNRALEATSDDIDLEISDTGKCFFFFHSHYSFMKNISNRRDF